MDEDLVLLDRWIAGDKRAGNDLFKRHFESIYRFFEHKIDSDAEDLVQETFLQLTRGRDRFQRQSSFRTYLFAIARNVLLYYWRKRTPSNTAIDFEEISIASLSTSVGTRLAKGQDRARLVAVLRTLPMEQQVLLEMFYWQDFDRPQLAEIFEVETATIGSRLSRARSALQSALEQTDAPRADQALDDWARSLADRT